MTPHREMLSIKTGYGHVRGPLPCTLRTLLELLEYTSLELRSSLRTC